MVPLFSDPDKALALLNEMHKWKGTKFMSCQGRARRGVCADCVTFVEAVLVSVGAIKPIVWPSYVTHTGGKSMFDLLVENFNRQVKNAELIWSEGSTFPRLMVGDIILCSEGNRGHHMAVYAGGNVCWHCLFKDGVTDGNVEDPILSANAKLIYRLHE